MYASPPQNAHSLTSPIQNITPSFPYEDKPKQNDSQGMKPITLRSEMLEMFNFAYPVTIATMARIIMYSIDAAFLGHLGTAQLAGSAMAGVCSDLTGTFLFAPGYGLNSLCSQAIGAGNAKLAGNWLQLALAVATIMLIPTFTILFFVKEIISPFEHDHDVLHYASLFGRYSCLFLVPTFIYMTIRQYFQALQIVHPATIVSILSVGVNVLLNQVLIYGMHLNLWKGHIHIEFDGLGFKGSPLATACSLSFQLTVFCVYAVWYKKYPVKAGAWDGWSFKSFKVNRIKNFFSVIGPMMVGDATENWSYQVVVLVCATLPAADVAANTVIFNIWGVLWSVFWGIGLATIVRSGKTISNGDIDGTKLIMKISAFLSIVVNGVISTMCYVFRRNIAKLFTPSEDVIEILDHAIPVLCLLFFVGGIGWSACSTMDGISRNVARSYVYSISAWLMFVPGAIYLAIYSKWRKQHKWSAICLIWEWALLVEIIRCALIWIVLLRTDWDKQVMLAKQRSETLKKNENETNKGHCDIIKASPKLSLQPIENDTSTDEDYDGNGKKSTIRKSKATDDYLCLN